MESWNKSYRDDDRYAQNSSQSQIKRKPYKEQGEPLRLAQNKHLSPKIPSLKIPSTVQKLNKLQLSMKKDLQKISPSKSKGKAPNLIQSKAQRRIEAAR